MLVVDPWPDLLAQMIERGLFIHRLPPKTLVACADEGFKKWRKLCAARLDEWKKRGLQNVFFIHPQAGELPEIQRLLPQLKEG